MEHIIEFGEMKDRTMDVVSVGRNGAYKTTGLSILSTSGVNGTIVLQGINSRRMVSVGDVTLPNNKEVCLALADFFRRMAEQ